MRVGMTVTIRDRTKAFNRKLFAHVDRQQGKAARHYRDVVVTDITRTKGSYYPPHHSKNPFAPFWISRELAKSYRVARAGRLEWLMGSDVPYSVYLEVGTATMLPRPHLVRNLILHRRPIAAIWCAPL